VNSRVIIYRCHDLQSAVSKPTVPSVPTYFVIPNPLHLKASQVHCMTRKQKEN